MPRKMSPEEDLFEEVKKEAPKKKLTLQKIKGANDVKLESAKAQGRINTPDSIRQRGEDESWDDDPDMSGSEDYKWAMEENPSDTAKALEAFMGKGDLRKESELSHQQIVACSLLLEMSGRYKLPRIKNAVHHFLACRVSLDRGSRKEAVTAFTGLVEKGKIAAVEGIANNLRRDGM